MVRLILLILYSGLSSAAYCQIIRGKVLDMETKIPITYATAYFSGTYIAAYTDAKGVFELNNTKNITMPLTVSALGYYSVYVPDYSTGKEIIVYLTPKVFEINEVVVNAKLNTKIRRENLDIFRREFLGTTPNAKDCAISNEDDIRFISSPDNDTIKAFSLKPIFVVNKALGYRVTYYLNKFEYNKAASCVDFIGSILFAEDTAATKNRQKYELRRRNAFLGSKMDLIRSLWNNNLDSSGFVVYDSKRKFSASDLVTKKMSLDPKHPKKYIRYTGTLPVRLFIRWIPGMTESSIDIKKGNIYFDETGYFDGSGIIWYGEMAKQGVADWLPYEYSLK
jgi:hypothetical protein